MDDGGRRDLLRALGAAGTLGLAGCQETEPTDDRETRDLTTIGSTTSVAPTTTGEKTTTESTETTEQTTTQEETTTQKASISFEVSVGEVDDARVLAVTGEVTSPSGVERVVVSAEEDTVRIDGDGASTRALDAELTVEGGRAYEVEVTVVETDGSEFAETVETGYVPAVVDALRADRLVGVHYYPWYEMHGGHEGWTDRTPTDPVLGEYRSDDRAVVDQHLQWCLEHGIRWLSVSWWGPNSGSDEALQGTILDAERFADVQFSILYETTARLGEFSFDLDDPGARNRLREDLQYLEAKFFGRENYLHLDGRPVVFYYVANTFHGDVEAAFEEVSRDLAVEPYLLADVGFGTAPNSHPVTKVADAVTTYNPYSPRPDIEEVFHDLYDHGNKVMHLGAEAADVGFVPTVIPGFNDTEIPDSQREDHPVLSSSPDRYERVVEQVSPHLPDAEAVLVTSFNEWYENTQIEPNETYGEAYLELTAERLATGDVPDFDPVGKTIRLAFDETVVPAEVNDRSSDTRELAFMAGGLDLFDGNEELRSFDIGTPGEEPLFLEGAYGTSSNESRSWRWFGGYSSETTIFVEGDVSNADRVSLYGQPMVSDEIEADVFVDGTKTDHVAFGKRMGRFDEYELSLSPGST